MLYVKYCSLLLLLMAGNTTTAQVPVREEPHHKPVLENNYVRLLDVHIKPGDTTLYHIHAAPSVMVHISKSTIGIQVMGQSIAPPVHVLPGDAKFAAYDKNPVTHRVYNAGKNVFHVMDIELVKEEPSSEACTALTNANVETTIDEKLVRVYKFDLSSQQKIAIPAGSCAHLLICTNGTVNTTGKKITMGKYIFFALHTEVSVNNKQAATATCVLLELK
ncbi:hypothetical protein FW778_21445 [Ginsengibacter hankyongi]|uniref:Uncharacterized protein n=1 Tax=Ginsengibacter hankyongi TaxID=2607284 RepID=A0A5J5IED2_9BACT|nr:hypothetical protein [Ginsengibacter hankyongi]KAA9035525.1 hypothetical protein FW778_21445 [Ginsengibacter hankyongi]